MVIRSMQFVVGLNRKVLKCFKFFFVFFYPKKSEDSMARTELVLRERQIMAALGELRSELLAGRCEILKEITKIMQQLEHHMNDNNHNNQNNVSDNKGYILCISDFLRVSVYAFEDRIHRKVDKIKRELEGEQKEDEVCRGNGIFAESGGAAYVPPVTDTSIIQICGPFVPLASKDLLGKRRIRDNDNDDNSPGKKRQKL